MFHHKCIVFYNFRPINSFAFVRKLPFAGTTLIIKCFAPPGRRVLTQRTRRVATEATVARNQRRRCRCRCCNELTDRIPLSWLFSRPHTTPAYQFQLPPPHPPHPQRT